MTRQAVLALLSFSIGVAALGCARPQPATPAPPVQAAEIPAAQGHAPKAPEAAKDPTERALDEVSAIHGAAGPWAVLGYRMSEHALEKLGLSRGSFDVQVVHWTPREVRYSCIADGAAAHSGASLGKLNLSLVDTTPDNVLTVYRNKKTGKSIALRPTAGFRERYADTPRDQTRTLGREVLGLPAEQLFEEIQVK